MPRASLTLEVTTPSGMFVPPFSVFYRNNALAFQSSYPLSHILFLLFRPCLRLQRWMCVCV